MQEHLKNSDKKVSFYLKLLSAGKKSITFAPQLSGV
jgi:hypothetical protein